jgi:ribosomal protein S18 acetylase RimI-like enzyme
MHILATLGAHRQFCDEPKSCKFTAASLPWWRVQLVGRDFKHVDGRMGLTYFKRYRMEISLSGVLPTPELPPTYALASWESALLEAHADAKYRSFCFEIDATVFPCLGERDGCRRLMDEISRRETFVPQATWLLMHNSQDTGMSESCGTIQGICDRHGYGAIQNLGVTPVHRGQGLGSTLLFQALHGFRTAGLRRAYLEVTAQNTGAVRLYHRLGFRRVKTVYKAAEVAYV